MPLLQACDVPEEFLRDTSFWLPADEMENLIQQASRFAESLQGEPLGSYAGRRGSELRCWGVLDSVLRMMPKPEDVFAQPSRFLSYFISPEPPVENLQRTPSSLKFDLPVSSDLYPLTTNYLAHAFESLPTYIGKQPAICRWQGIHLEIHWESRQEDLLPVEDLGRQFSPDLMRSILDSLQVSQTELESRKQQLIVKERELLQMQKQSAASRDFGGESQLDNIRSETVLVSHMNQEASAVLQQNIARLADYMTRAQQLITIMVGRDRLNPEVKAAMKKVDWERVQLQFPKTIEECQQVLAGENRV